MACYTWHVVKSLFRVACDSLDYKLLVEFENNTCLVLKRQFPTADPPHPFKVSRCHGHGKQYVRTSNDMKGTQATTAFEVVVVTPDLA